MSPVWRERRGLPPWTIEKTEPGLLGMHFTTNLPAVVVTVFTRSVRPSVLQATRKTVGWGGGGGGGAGFEHCALGEGGSGG